MGTLRHNRVFLLLGNQLFPPALLQRWQSALFVMAEDRSACTYLRHHKQKLVLILSAMRAHADLLRSEGFDINYTRLEEPEADLDFTERLRRLIKSVGYRELVHFEIEDKALEQRIADFARRYELRHTVLPSPMFGCGRDEFAEWIESRRDPRMADFYRWQRQRHEILLDDDGKPLGGQWSHDADNRRPLPQDVFVPELPQPSQARHVRKVIKLVNEEFSDHPGSTDEFWLPTTRSQALRWLRDFFEQRFTNFGAYEDALTQRSDVVFHSALSPLMNIGLLTPDEILQGALEFAADEDVPINSTEGFVRQIIGWREFIRGMYHTREKDFTDSNFWKHERALSEAWREGSTGIPPLDQVIEKTHRLGWAHHIERLMVVGNLMQLCEIEPRQAYRWFMENFVDAYDWVMVPNVYGMALFSDGGMFATKPYLCASSYLMRMGDYGKGSWTETVDGLFWRFMALHRDFFAEQPRLRMLLSNLDRMSATRRERLNRRAEEFLNGKTQPAREIA